MPESSIQPFSEEYYGEAPISVSHIFHVIRRYTGVILLSIAAVALAYLIIAAASYLLSPRQKVTSVPFRLEFSGASEGHYPNGLRFSVADVIATPVLLDVYKQNGVDRFVSFEKFSRSVFALESNRELERLTSEYATKLADPKLTPVDRDRIEREFESKRNSISKSEYTLQYVPATPQDIPNVVITKTLNDILSTWSRRAAVEKKALDYQVSVISPSALSNITVSNNDYLVPLLLLRQRLNDAIVNGAAVEEMPGAKLVRLPTTKLSIADVRANLDEVLRYRVEPLVISAYKSGAASAASIEVARAQLAYDQRALDAAQAREVALRNVLLTYESQGPGPRTANNGQAQPTVPSSSPRLPNGETVMPQLSDTFIDRIAELTSRSGDTEYRQRLTDEIKASSLAVVPAQASVKYDQELLDMFQRGAAGSSQNAAAMQQQWESTFAAVRQAITDLNSIYTLASRQLYPETEMYRVTGPTVSRVDRAVSPARLLLYGTLVLLIAFPIIIVLAFVHNRVREEEAAEFRQPAASTV